jgi:CelD/BcsL family acetyltransferase involved in cellulose biosynthesis
MSTTSRLASNFDGSETDGYLEPLPPLGPSIDAGLDLAIDVVANVAGLETLRADYERLHWASANTSPFALHEWHIAWVRQFLNLDAKVTDELAVLALRNRERACVSIVPLVISRRRFGPAQIVSINLLGADPSTTESRTPLIEPGYEAAVARALRRHLDAIPDWDWINWSGVSAEFGSALAQAGRMRLHEEAPGYVLRLAPTWREFRDGLKRNIRESLRHCYNSLKRDGLEFAFEIAEEPGAVRRGLEKFFELHAKRARMPGTVDHPDHFASEVSRRFLFDVCERFAARRAVRVFQLRIGADIVAVRIGFIVGDCLSLYYSGFDPRWARYGVMTTTIAEAMKYAIEAGLETVNLSRGTDMSKTRWGPAVVPYVCASEPHRRLGSRIAYHCYSSARSGKGLPSWILRRLGQAHRVWR